MYHRDEIKVFTLISGAAILKSGTADSDTLFPGGFPMDSYHIDKDNCSIEVLTTGTGTVKVEHLLSYDGTNFSDCGTDITTGHAAGRKIYPFASGEPYVAPYMKILVTEEGVNAITSCTVKLCARLRADI